MQYYKWTYVFFADPFIVTLSSAMHKIIQPISYYIGKNQLLILKMHSIDKIQNKMLMNNDFCHHAFFFM
jgi:hypothetical protein